MYYKNKTVLISGASRGIGRAIALKLAGEGANIVIAAKSTTEDPRLGGTIFSVAKEVESAGGNALPVFCDIRDENLTRELMERTSDAFGSLDILINNASAINLADTLRLEPKRFDLMFDINVRGTFMMTKFAYPLLKASVNPHILTLSPPLNLDMKWFRPHLAYTLSKYSMTLMARAWAEEFKKDGIASNTLWPATTIATAAIKNLPGGEELIHRSRKPGIMADAAFYLLQLDSKKNSGHSYLDEEVLKDAGVTDLGSYAISQGGPLQADLFL
jgi:citronellol/citronellal dehydrogenase